MKHRLTPENITTLQPNEVFVFGSNLAGHHGGGAAKLAYLKFGAVYGEGIGHFGQSYALPTKDKNIETLPIETIGTRVEELYNYIVRNNHLFFIITKVGCGLAGYNTEEIKPLFVKFIGLENISLPYEFLS